MIVRILVTIAASLTSAFGVWHFFVPAQWNWYSYISPQATELVLAVRAINVFFSLCLVLIGIANILFVYFSPTRFALIVMLSLSGVLWATRCVFQIVYPQGSSSPILQYGMLTAFILIFISFLISLMLVIFNKTLV